MKEFEKLDKAIREQFKRKLAERLQNPRVEADKLKGMADCYKIKLRVSGFRLVYRVEDEAIVVAVMSVGKRQGSAVYKAAQNRLGTVRRGKFLAE